MGLGVEWGPLARLVGVWEGDKGDDTAPSDDRGTEKNFFRETITFVAVVPNVNHEQTLHGLRYSQQTIRLNEEIPFHEETGYWLWDARAKHLTRCSIVPRGVAFIAGATIEPNANKFTLVAEMGSPTYGISCNPFLHEEFRPVKFEMKVTLDKDGSLAYEQTTWLKMKGRPDLFAHIDKNRLNKIR